jgi:hypothetical protein
MGIFNRFFQSPASSPKPPAPAAPPAPARPKSLSEIEAEIAAAQKARQQKVQQQFQQKSPSGSTGKRTNGLRRFCNRLIGTTMLLGIPVGALWLINLPNSPLRRPIAQNAPILLLPSRISIDHHFRQAIANAEEATQLIDGATSFEDILRGEQKLAQTQASLDRLPIRATNDWSSDWGDDRAYYGLYDWRFSIRSFNETRAQIGRLKAKVFQEKNARTAFESADQELGEVKQRYRKAETLVEKQQAIALWRGAINRLSQIPEDTFSGRAAQKVRQIEEQQILDVAGVEMATGKSSAYISAAQGYAKQASELSQNPPHPKEVWDQAASLWSEAIEKLERVPEDDLNGYAEAQKLRATYQTNLGQIRTRATIESQSSQAFANAQEMMPSLTYSRDSEDRARYIQRMVFELEKVKPGTSSYAKAQDWLQDIKEKLQ